MPTYQVISDVHVETNKTLVIDVIRPVADNLIVAGDVGQPTDANYHKFFDFVTSNWKTVIYVPGNHEYYDMIGIMTMKRTDDMIEELGKKYPNLYCLNNSSIKLDGITFIGSTLWSHPKSTNKLSDFRMHIFDDEGCITLDRYIKINQKCIGFLESALGSTSPDDKVVVITHYMPLMKRDIPDSKFPDDPEIDSYMGNGLYNLINKANVWVSGHTHEQFEVDYKGTKWLCNAYGQLFEKMEYKPMTFTI